MKTPTEPHGSGTNELDPDEPATPLWLSLLGLGLFLMAALYFLVRPSADDPASSAASAAGADAGAAEKAPAPSE